MESGSETSRSRSSYLGATSVCGETKLSLEEMKEKERKEYEEALQRYREWLDQHPFGNEPFKKIRVPRIRERLEE